MISSLEEILISETKGEVRLTQIDGMLIRRLVLEEIKGNPDHGIGFNGLFIAFHCFRSTYKQMKSATTVKVATKATRDDQAPAKTGRDLRKDGRAFPAADDDMAPDGASW